jgi:hypothetical protein
LVEEGVNLYQDITEEEFKDKIKNEYEFIKDVMQGNVDIF